MAPYVVAEGAQARPVVVLVSVGAALPWPCVEVKARVAVFRICCQVQRGSVRGDGARYAVRVVANNFLE